jgi:pumilio homology domain family member 6
MASGGGDLQSQRKRKREHPEGRTTKAHGGAGTEGKAKQPYGGAAEVAAKKKPVTPREMRLAAKVPPRGPSCLGTLELGLKLGRYLV